MSPLSTQPLSPLDGRYQHQVSALGEHLSEAGLNRARIQVEVEWIIHLTDHEMFGARRLAPEEQRQLRQLVTEFDDDDIADLARREAVTRHDVKAVEYVVRDRLTALGLTEIAELTHFACTSEDINNLAYAITIRAAVRDVWMPRVRSVVDTLRALALSLRDVPMLAHTHGQPATPTTMGKELAVVVHRLELLLATVDEVEYRGKFSGATGTFSAHLAADPDDAF